MPTIGDVFTELAGVITGVAGVAQTRRERKQRIELSRFSAYTREGTTALMEEIRTNQDYDSYERLFEERFAEFEEELVTKATDPLVVEAGQEWLRRQREAVRSQVSELAWQRERAHEVAELQNEIDRARGFGYEDRREQFTDSIETAYQAGYIGPDVRDRLIDEEEAALLYDQTIDAMTLRYNADDGGYEKALMTITRSELNDTAKRSAIAALNQLDAVTQRRRQIELDTEKNALYVGIYTGETQIRDVLASAQSATDKDWLISRIEEVAEKRRRVGEGETTQIGERRLSSFYTDIDRGADRIGVIEEARRAWLDEQIISETDFNRIRSYEGLPEYKDHWDSIEEAAVEAGVDPIEMMTDVRQRLGSILFVRDQDGNWTRNPEITDKEAREFFRATMQEVAGEKALQQALYATEFHRDESGSRDARRLNAPEEALREIDDGRLRGYTDVYREQLDHLAAGHERILNSVALSPYIENVVPRGIDGDGRPTFYADTPVGRQEVAFFSKDPNSGEEFTDETLFFWRGDRQRWERLSLSGAPEAGGVESRRDYRVMIDGAWHTKDEETGRLVPEGPTYEEQYLQDDEIFGAGPQTENRTRPRRNEVPIR